MKAHIVLSVFLFLIFNQLTSQSVTPNEIYNELLSKYVSIEGKVNYRGFIKEKEKFQQYLDYLSSNKPEKNEPKNVRLAYWINAYNAFTIKLIIDNYPLKSITELHPYYYIPMYNTVWHKAFFRIDDEDYSLDRIEHDILRKEFKEPGIHFAINCASKSCPDLRNEIYTASKINDQLQDQTRFFLSDSTKNRISGEQLELSALFSWFREDFEIDGELVLFIDRYTDISISREAEITFLPYDWSLNE